MRKLLVLLFASALVTSSSGCCGCLGKVRNWFHKGSPCGTRVAPATLGAPITMAAPAPIMMAAPSVQCIESAPMCSPCETMCDPCGNPCDGYTTGYNGSYFGGYVGGSSPVGCSNCGESGMIVEGDAMSSPATLSPAPAGLPRYGDPGPAN